MDGFPGSDAENEADDHASEDTDYGFVDGLDASGLQEIGGEEGDY